SLASSPLGGRGASAPRVTASTPRAATASSRQPRIRSFIGRTGLRDEQVGGDVLRAVQDAYNLNPAVRGAVEDEVNVHRDTAQARREVVTGTAHQRQTGEQPTPLIDFSLQTLGIAVASGAFEREDFEEVFTGLGTSVDGRHQPASSWLSCRPIRRMAS